MLVIPQAIYAAVLAHGRAGFPQETCGLLGGRDGIVRAFHPMTNLDQSREHFRMEPKEQFAAVKALRAQGLAIVAVYHTHPDTPARPSEEDIRLARTPGVSTVILSLAGPEPVLKSFRIEAGVAAPEPVEIREAAE